MKDLRDLFISNVLEFVWSSTMKSENADRKSRASQADGVLIDASERFLRKSRPSASSDEGMADEECVALPDGERLSSPLIRGNSNLRPLIQTIELHATVVFVLFHPRGLKPPYAWHDFRGIFWYVAAFILAVILRRPELRLDRETITIIPAPFYKHDDEAYLRPYFLRGWFPLFKRIDGTGMPAAYTRQATTEETLQRAHATCSDFPLSIDELLHFVEAPDPLQL